MHAMAQKVIENVVMEFHYRVHGGGWVGILMWVIRVGLTKKVTSGQVCKRVKETGHGDICEEKKHQHIRHEGNT